MGRRERPGRTTRDPGRPGAPGTVTRMPPAQLPKTSSAMRALSAASLA